MGKQPEILNRDLDSFLELLTDLLFEEWQAERLATDAAVSMDLGAGPESGGIDAGD